MVSVYRVQGIFISILLKKSKCGRRTVPFYKYSKLEISKQEKLAAFHKNSTDECRIFWSGIHLRRIFIIGTNFN